MIQQYERIIVDIKSGLICEPMRQFADPNQVSLLIQALVMPCTDITYVYLYNLLKGQYIFEAERYAVYDRAYIHNGIPLHYTRLMEIVELAKGADKIGVCFTSHQIEYGHRFRHHLHPRSD